MSHPSQENSKTLKWADIIGISGHYQTSALGMAACLARRCEDQLFIPNKMQNPTALTAAIWLGAEGFLCIGSYESINYTRLRPLGLLQ